MSNTQHASYLKAITGVVLISKDGEDLLCCLEDMQSTKHFSIGQIFNAVRVLYGKSVDDYGTLWPRYRPQNNSTEQTSNDWKHLSSAYENCESDYDFLVEACNQLQEEVPEVVTRSEVERKLNLLKDVLVEMTKQ